MKLRVGTLESSEPTDCEITHLGGDHWGVILVARCESGVRVRISLSHMELCDIFIATQKTANSEDVQRLLRIGNGSDWRAVLRRVARVFWPAWPTQELRLDQAHRWYRACVAARRAGDEHQAERAREEALRWMRSGSR